MLVIRLRQQGANSRQSFRLVVTNERSPRDGKYIEMLGFYDPFAKENNLTVDRERVQYWYEHGALISARAQILLKKSFPEVIVSLKARKEKQLAKKRKARKK